MDVNNSEVGVFSRLLISVDRIVFSILLYQIEIQCPASADFASAAAI